MTADKPLPMGPIHLVWQDAVVIGVLTALAAWHARINPAPPAVVFGLVYLCGMTLLLAFTRRWRSCLVLGFLWWAAILPGAEGAPTIALVTAIVAVIWRGHRKNLKAFAWQVLGSSNRPSGSILQREIRIDALGVARAGGASFTVGWPFLALSPKVQPYCVSTLTSICLSALIGWWSSCLIEGFKTEPLPELMLFFAVFAAIIRLAIYCSGLAPSFNLWG